jgi:hypothetical protein
MQQRGLSFAAILSCFLCPSFARAQAPPAIEGSVVNSITGQPVPDARVKLTRPEGEPLYTKTDAAGHFQFAVPQTRGASISAERPGYAQRPARMAVRLGSTAVSIQMFPMGVIAGRVIDPNGVPVEGCPVEILQKRPVSERRPGGGPAGQPLPGGQYEIVRLNAPRTNDLGEFRAAQLDPGTYYVVANNGRLNQWPGDYRITYYPRALDLASAKPIELAAGQQARADIQIVRREGVRVQGRLAGPAVDSTPAGRVRYTRLMLVPQQNYLVNANGPFAMARSAEFEFTDVLPGSYTLVALTSERPASDVWGGDDHAAFGITRPIEIEDQDMDGLVITPQQLGEIPGTITFAEGCAPAPVRIMVRSDSQLGAGQQPQAASGADGKFVLRGLSPGTLKLMFTNASTAAVPVIPLSVRLGEREVLKDGFVYPFEGGDTLKVVLGCFSANRRPQ